MRCLPPERRHHFQAPFGTLYPDFHDVLPLLPGRTVYAVGDVVTRNLLEAGVTPDLVVVDGFTMRAPFAGADKDGQGWIRVRNPAGTITQALEQALKEAVRSKPARIFVEGEEDLAVIPLVLVGEEGALVLYGQPGEGVVVRPIDADARVKAQEYLAFFTSSDAPSDTPAEGG